MSCELYYDEKIQLYIFLIDILRNSPQKIFGDLKGYFEGLCDQKMPTRPAG